MHNTYHHIHLKFAVDGQHESKSVEVDMTNSKFISKHANKLSSAPGGNGYPQVVSLGDSIELKVVQGVSERIKIELNTQRFLIGDDVVVCANFFSLRKLLSGTEDSRRLKHKI